MNALKDIQDAIKLRLHNQSVQTLDAVDKAAKVIRYLHLHGCTVQQVVVRPGYVVLEIDKPGDWLKGAMHISRVNGRYREVVRVASVMSCQVQWTEREEHPLLQREH